MRYVIKKEGAGYYTEMVCVETKPVFLNGNCLGHDNVMRPQFEAFRTSQASQFDTEQDAVDLMANAQFGAPASFEGCVVEPSQS